jgi:Flp pilus assembly pilin Flp
MGSNKTRGRRRKGDKMPKPKKTEHALNAGEAKVLKATIERLNGLSARQALMGIVNVLSSKAHLHVKLFEEIIDDAWRLAQLTEQKGTSAVEYALLVVGIAAACLLGVGLLGDTVRQMFKTAADLFYAF